MYLDYWGLKKKPFENHLNADFYYPSQTHQANLLKLRYALEDCRGSGILAGETGVGKTMVTRMLKNLATDHAVSGTFVHVVFPQMNTRDLLGYIAAEMVSQPVGQGAETVDLSLRRIEHFLLEAGQTGRHTVLVIDEAHLIDDLRTFQALKLLLNIEYHGVPCLSLLLVGAPSLFPIIGRLESFEERIDAKCMLQPFTEEETAAYIVHRLREAGQEKEIIQSEAFPLLHELTQGIPRKINRLCDLGLLIGFAEGFSSISPAHVEALNHELVAAEAA
jgi:general secretion pathway protein A